MPNEFVIGGPANSTPDYTEIAGGVGEIKVATLAHGGENVIIGGSAKSLARDRVLHLKYVPDDTRALLAIIDMARPVTWGKLEYDDGSTDSKLGRRSPEPDAALMAELTERLAASPDKVAERLIIDFSLREPVMIALVDMIKCLIDHLKKHRPGSRPIAVDGDVGEIMARLEDGSDYFKVATGPSADKLPASLSAIVREVLNIMVKIKCNRPSVTVMDTVPTLRRPVWPEISADVRAKMTASAKSCATVRQCVEAITMREWELTDHLDQVEQYYVDTARDIVAYTTALHLHFEGCT